MSTEKCANHENFSLSTEKCANHENFSLSTEKCANHENFSLSNEKCTENENFRKKFFFDFLKKTLAKVFSVGIIGHMKST